MKADMDENKHKEELIDRFLRDQLSPEERSEFESLLEKDKTFKEELNIMSHIKISLEKRAEAQTLEKILSISSKQEFENIISKTGNPHRQKPRKMSIYVAATAVACLIFIFIYTGMQPKYSTSSLFKEYYTDLPYENIPTRGGNSLSDEQNELCSIANQLYREKKYAEASTQYNKAINGLEYSQIPENILFYSSMCLIETKQYDKVVNSFEYLFDNGVYYPDQAGWYLALVYIEEGKREEAKFVLQKLIDDNTEYKEQSAELLNKLNKKHIF